MDINNISVTNRQANEPQPGAQPVDQPQANRTNASVQGAVNDLSDWTLVDSEPLSQAEKDKLQRARLARSSVDSAITDMARSLGRLRTFLNVITLWLYKLFSKGADEAAAAALKGSYAVNEGTGLVKLALDQHEDDFGELSKGRERALGDINVLCKRTLEDFHSGVYGDNFDRPLNAREQAAKSLMEEVRDSVRESAGFWITDERFETLATTFQASLLGFAQLHLLRRAESVDDLDEAGQRSLLKEALTEAAKDLLRLDVGKPKSIAPLSSLVPAADMDFLKDASAHRLLLRVYGELKKIEGPCPGYNLSGAQRPDCIRIVVKMLKAVADGIADPQKRAAALAQVVEQVTKSDQSFDDFMVNVMQTLGAPDEKSWDVLKCVENFQELQRISHDIDKIKDDLKSLKAQQAQNPELARSPVSKMIASIEAIKPPPLKFDKKPPTAEELQFAKFLFAQVKSLLTVGKDAPMGPIRTEAYFPSLEFTNKVGLDDVRMNLLKKMVKDSLDDVFSKGDFQTFDQFKEHVGRAFAAANEIVGGQALLTRLSPGQAQRFLDMPKLNFVKAFESLSTGGKPLSKTQAVAFLGSLVDVDDCYAKIQAEGLDYVRKQAAALTALSQDNLNGLAQGNVPVLNPPDEALASRFELLKNSVAFKSLMGMEWTSPASKSLFDKMRDAGAVTLLYGKEADLKKYLSVWKDLREAVDEIAQRDDVKAQARGGKDVRAKIVRAIQPRDIADWVAKGGDVRTFKDNCVEVFVTQKNEFDGLLADFRKTARDMGLDEKRIDEVFAKDVCHADVFELGDLPKGSLLTSERCDAARKAVEKLKGKVGENDGRLAVLKGVKEKYDSSGTRAELKPFLKAVAELLLQKSGVMFRSVDDAVSFAETLLTTTSRKDKEEIDAEADGLRQAQAERNADGVKRGVVRTLIRVAETSVRVIRDPAVMDFIGSRVVNFGGDEEAEIRQVLSKAILESRGDSLMTVVSSEGVVPRIELYGLSAEENRFDNYSQDRKTLMDRLFGDQGPMSNKKVQDSAAILCQALFGV